MPVIVVANPKGGVGKSTVATNLAGAFARAGHAVMLGDVDRQQSARQWLALRPSSLPPIQSWEVARDDIVRPPKGTTHVVLDTPAGLHDKKLDRVLAVADRVLLPLQPSLFDIQATPCLRAERCVSTSAKMKIAVVGNRVQARPPSRPTTCASFSTRSGRAGAGDAARHAACTCSSPRAAQRCGTWRRAAPSAIWCSGSRSWTWAAK